MGTASSADGNVTDASVAADVAAIHARLAALADEPHRDGVAEELGAIRAQLQALATANAEVGDRLAAALGLRSSPRHD